LHAIRRRTGASAVAAFFVAAPLAIGGAAYAAEPETNSQVVFSGDGLLGVACGAKPSASSVTVPAESTLRVVNNTGRKAKLLLDGAARGEVAPGATADVLFHRGPVELALKPDCMLADEKAVRVEVLAAPPPPTATGNDTPANPPVPPFGGGTGDSDDSDDPAPAGDDRQREDRPDGADAEPAAGASPGAADPADRDADPANPDADPTNPDAAPAVPDSFDGGTGIDGATSVAAAEPLASVDPVSDSGPTGLLALIATVCVVGVSAGAIRAIIAQRASRTRAA
jgi:hypothetical protein